MMSINTQAIAGCDEAGRGALAGPVVAAVVILSGDKVLLKQVKDSKLLTPQKRANIRRKLEKQALAWAIGQASAAEIDKINILQATFLAMHRAITKLLKKFSIKHLLVDGNHFKPYPNLNHTCIIKGDLYIPSISAASILAKTYRDDIMEELHKQYPLYHWNRNKGYPTPQHRKAINEQGITPFHRTSYQTCQMPFKE